MGKKEQSRRRQRARSASARHELPWWGTQVGQAARGGTPEAVKMAQEFSADNEVACRATFLSDPAFGGAAANAPDAGSLPVLLLEPKRMMALHDMRTGSMHEARTEALISGGFRRVDGPVWQAGPCDGWGLYRDDSEVFLRDPDGQVATRSRAALDPAWVSAAISLGWVLVLYGYPLGVTVPPGKTERSYTAIDRAREITQARRTRCLAAALVAWRGALTETLDWVLFPPGAFGLALPMAYVPLWEFTVHGGPGEFGFSRLDPRVTLPVAEGMTASITTTDLDLVRPDAGEIDRLIAGYRAGTGPADERFFEAWRQSALSAGGLVVMTGTRQIPNVLGASQEQDQLAYEAMRQSWGARVVLDDSSRFAVPGTPPPGPARRQPREVITRGEQQAEYLQLRMGKLAEQESFEIHIADAVRDVIVPEALQPWLTNLWPLACQTCGDPLGSRADLSADGPVEGEKILISLHHSGCRPSGTTPPEGVTMSCPTTSFVAGYLAQPDGKPRRSDIPVMVINPSCEQLQLVRDASGRWRNATVEAFAGLGLTRPDGNAPPNVRDMEAEIDGDYLVVTVTGHIPHAPDHQFALKPPRHVLEQVRRMKGIAVSVVTKVVPSLLGFEDLPAAFSDESAVTGWVPLAGDS
jgi:hypothetical protein